MTDKYRCTNAFAFEDRIYAGGTEVEDGDPILGSHGGHFARVQDRPAVFETATAEPGEQRDLTPPRKTAAKKAAPKHPPAKPTDTSTEDDDQGKGDDA